MRLHVFDIVLTRDQGVYFSGQMLQGHVILELNKTIKVTGIRMVCRGKAFVHWTDQNMRGPGESRFREIRHHSATEQYFDFCQQLLSQGNDHNGDQQWVLEAGQYTYPFQFQIPPAAPSSFEGQYGFVRYWVKVTIERQWKNEVSVKKLFTVICPVDLNRDETASQPLHAERQKRVCCMCCTSGPLTADLRLSHKGYVPGEEMHILADIHNLTRRKVGSTSIELLMTTTYRSLTKTRSVTQLVAKLQHKSIPSGSSDSWEGDRLVIPPLPPSYMIGCGIMDIRYTLELNVYPVGPAFVLAVPLEILIGTVPLHATMERYLTMHQMTPPTPRHPGVLRGAGPETNSSPPQYLSPIYSPSPLCKYQLKDDKDDHDTILDDHFLPCYVHFNFQVVQSRRHHTVRFAT